MPFAGPSNFTLTFGGQTYALAQDYPRLGAGPTGTPTPSATSSSPPPHGCTIPAWSASKIYVGGNQASYQGHNWTAKWWTQGETPGSADVWQDNGAC
jgi:chitinase